MTLEELYNRLRDSLSPSRAKDLKTAIRYFATALGYSAPAQVQDAEAYEGSYRPQLRAYFETLEQTPALYYTIRNTLNNVGFLYRTARAHGLIRDLPPTSASKARIVAYKELHRTSPYGGHQRQGKYALPVTQWPQALHQTWQRYCTEQQQSIRPITLKMREEHVCCYVGYLIGIEKVRLTQFTDLFDPMYLTRFTAWHTQHMGAFPLSVFGHHVAQTVLTLANYFEDPSYATLKKVVHRLPQPEPMHDKQHPDHSITLQTLEAVGLGLRQEAHGFYRRFQQECAARSRPRQKGLFGALRNQMALILRLLVRVPLRSRNIREMQLATNLFKDAQGLWTIRFRGKELKVASRNGRINEVRSPFPPELVEHLEEFLTLYRPLLPNAVSDPHVFLTRGGRPFGEVSLTAMLRLHVFVHTNGKRFYPHLIRTIWTDAMLLEGADISTVAFRLNDRPETVLRRYHELRANDHNMKAEATLQRILGRPTTV